MNLGYDLLAVGGQIVGIAGSADIKPDMFSRSITYHLLFAGAQLSTCDHEKCIEVKEALDEVVNLLLTKKLKTCIKKVYKFTQVDEALEENMK